MFDAVIREGEIVTSPSGREWVVIGNGEEGRVRLVNPADPDDMVDLPARLLRHRSSNNVGLTLGEIAERDMLSASRIEAGQ